MMQLTTVSERINDRTARVFWRVGVARSGILEITLQFDSKDSDLIAELVAIRYLLLEEKVLGVEPMSGVGYTLNVSKGAIKKLVRKKSVKLETTGKFAAFLSMRMKGCEIKVSKDMNYMSNLEDTSVEYIQAKNSIYAATYEPVETPAIGNVLITQHALDQYQDRIESGSTRNPFQSLVKRLQHPDLTRYDLPDNVKRHKQIKYGKSDNIEAWSHDSSDMVFLIVDDEDKKVLVTAFSSRKAKREMTKFEPEDSIEKAS